MDTKYPIDPSDWKSCTVDSDCVGGGAAGNNDDDDDEEEYFCLPHMWEYNKQLDSGHGCWSPRSVPVRPPTKCLMDENCNFGVRDNKRPKWPMSKLHRSA